VALARRLLAFIAVDFRSRMNFRLYYLSGIILLLLLTACETRRPAHSAEQPESAQTAALPAAPAPVPVADTADLTRRSARWPGPLDSLIQIGSRHYRLAVRVETDSTRPIDFEPAESLGPGFAAPSDTAWRAHRVRGYQQTYTFTLRDSLGKALVFRRQLHKPDFYPVAPSDEVTVMDMPRPGYLGYSAALEALVFVCYLNVPGTDIGWHATLLLDRRGRVRRLSPSGPAYSNAADCDPRVSPSGRAVLTCTEVLRAGQPPLKLDKSHAELQVARFLNDTTLLVVYANGDYRARRAEPVATGPVPLPVPGASETAPMTEYEFLTTPAQRRLPTAFVLSTSGRVLRRFRLVASGALAFDLPRLWVKPAGTYLFLEEGKKLVVVPKAHPDRLVELPLRSLPRFELPRRPREKVYEFSTDFTHARLYVDTLNPQAIRWQRLPPAQ
jgi:hypothetical protein